MVEHIIYREFSTAPYTYRFSVYRNYFFFFLSLSLQVSSDKTWSIPVTYF